MIKNEVQLRNPKSALRIQEHFIAERGMENAEVFD